MKTAETVSSAAQLSALRDERKALLAEYGQVMLRKDQIERKLSYIDAIGQGAELGAKALAEHARMKG